MNKELFLNGYIERIANKFELSNDLAFEILSIAAILDLSFDEIYDTVSTIVNKSGSHDGGLDGIYLNEDEDVLHIFQIKASANIGDNQLSKFIDDYENLFVYGNPTNLPLNEKVNAELEKYKSLAKSGRIFETKLYFIFNGNKTEQNAPLINRHLDKTRNLQIFDSNDLFQQIDSLISEGRKRKDIEFSFMAAKSNIATKTDPQALISFGLKNIKSAVNFRLATLELCRLLDEEKQLNNRIDTIFSDNIRGFLNYNKTNKNIRDTLNSDEYAEYFPFLNNGITIIAENITFPETMQADYYPIKAKNPIIVNGLQTTHVIYDIYQKDRTKLEDVYVLVRLYETTDSKLIDKITDATNTQSLINYRDKISNRNFNKYTKEVFNNAGIGYLCKRGETFGDELSKSLKKSVHSETVLKFWYSSFHGCPEIAKNSKSKVLEELFDATTNKDNKLNELFNGNKNSIIYQQLLEAFWLYDFIMQKRKSMNNNSDFVLFSDELFAYGIYRLFRKNGETKLKKYLFESYYQEIYQAIKSCVNKRITKLSEYGQTYSHNGYFKSSQSRTDLNDEINLWLDEDNL